MSRISIYTVTGLTDVTYKIFVTLQTWRSRRKTVVPKRKEEAKGNHRKANFSPTEIVKLVDLVALNSSVLNNKFSDNVTLKRKARFSRKINCVHVGKVLRTIKVVHHKWDDIQRFRKLSHDSNMQ